MGYVERNEKSLSAERDIDPDHAGFGMTKIEFKT